MKSLIIIAAAVLTVACHQQPEHQHAQTAQPATSTAAARTADGVQTVDLKISGGEYQPASFKVRAGVPVRLNVTRDEQPGCGDVLVIPAHDISRTIPVNQPTTIEFTPAAAGELEFTCGMNMMRGKIVVEGA